eukprot:5956190-Heterocapsa_arctica.AAC.1
MAAGSGFSATLIHGSPPPTSRLFGAREWDENDAYITPDYLAPNDNPAPLSALHRWLRQEPGGTKSGLSLR